MEDPRHSATPPLSVAPMMDRTDRHFRHVLRLLTRHTLLYTEMITTHAILRGPRARLLRFASVEHPVALQLGGDDPEALAECVRIAQDLGYDEVNLNVGCPSDRVKSGHFGACLMAHPERVAQCVAAMKAVAHIPVTVKHRIGIDDLDRYEDMARFVSIVKASGTDRFTVHARKAWLSGLSPKQNRTIPPLRYDDVYRLKREHPDCSIEINGGIKDLASAREHLRHVDAVMIGRAAYDDPWCLAAADRAIFGDSRPAPTRTEVFEQVVTYAERELSEGAKLGAIARHLFGLATGQPGARAFRRHLSVYAHRSGANVEVLREAFAHLEVKDVEWVGERDEHDQLFASRPQG